MTGKPIRARAIAHRDIEATVDFYLREGGVDAASRFIAALESAYADIAVYPDAGSPRYGLELNLPGLRTRILAPFPHLIFYIAHETHIEIWRVLHGHRDMPASLRDDDNQGR